MNIKHIAILFITVLTLPGCAKQTPATSCSSADTEALIARILTNQAAKLTADKRYDYYEGSFVFGGVKIRAALDQVQVAIERAETIKKDADNNKKLCTGLLKITVPTTTLADAEQARQLQNEAKIAEYAKQFNIENNANVFTQEIEYKVQLTGDGKKQEVDIESAGWANLLDQIVTFALLKPTLDTQQADQVRLNEQPKQELERLNPEPAEAELDKVKAKQEKQGLERLNEELFEAEQVQKELLQEQRASAQVTPKPSASATTATSVSPSFNCTKATRDTEMTICANPDLAALDVANMKIYMKAKAMDAVATKEIWRQSIKSKYACRADVECIKAVYDKSIASYGCISAGRGLDCAVYEMSPE